jgi:NADH:ubiquinone oxidoreductase subunit 5 (subunit L)/multisubunit Na+/H+ antiporter MnhA subunit
VVGSLAVIFSVDYMQGEGQLKRYYSFILLFIGAMTGLLLSGNLLFMFFFWEITALCSYALISFYNDDPKAVAGGIKALIITQVGGWGWREAGAYAALGSYPNSDLLGKTGSFCELTRSDRVWVLLAAKQIGTVSLPYLVARCHGSTDANQCPHPCRDNGQCRCISAGTFLPGV